MGARPRVGTDRAQALPTPPSEYTITRDLPVPDPDGVTLRADMYEPTGARQGHDARPIALRMSASSSPPSPVACLRRPWLPGVLARCRGTFGSGACRSNRCSTSRRRRRHRRLDAATAWFDGRFATHGGSYMAFTQWAMFMDPPPELVTASSGRRPTTSGRRLPGRRVRPQRLPGVDGSGPSPQEEHGTIAKLLLGHAQGTTDASPARRPPNCRSNKAGERLLARVGPWYREWISRPRPGRSVLGDAIATWPSARAPERARCSCSPAGRTSSSTRRSNSTERLPGPGR